MKFERWVKSFVLRKSIYKSLMVGLKLTELTCLYSNPHDYAIESSKVIYEISSKPNKNIKRGKWGQK